MGAASGATTLSAVFLGKLGDKVGHRKVLIACSLAAGLLYLPQALVGSTWQLMFFYILVGIAVGGVIPTISALLTRYTRHGEEGAVFGLDNSINAAGRSAAPMLGAWVAATFGFRDTFLPPGMVFLISAVAAFILLPNKNEPITAIPD